LPTVEADGGDYASERRRNRITAATTKAMRDAGIDDASCHSLRHTAATWDGPGRHFVVRGPAGLGHTTPVKTQRYAHLQPGHLLRAVNAVDKKLKASRERETPPASTK
jgi:integrase